MLARTTIDRHIWGEWLRVFAMTLGVILGLLVLGNMSDDLPDLMGFGASWGQIAAYYRVLLPTFLPAILPISILVSMLFALGRLHRNGEVIALRAAGLGVNRITRSLWISAVVLTMILFWLNARVVPLAAQEARERWNELSYAHALRKAQTGTEVGVVHNLAFRNHRDNRLWFINRYNERLRIAEGVTVSTFDTAGRELLRYQASEGTYTPERGWTLRRGRELHFDVASGDVLYSPGFDERNLRGFDDPPELMRFMKKRPKDLSLDELHRILDASSQANNPRLRAYEVKYYEILFSPLSCLVVAAIAIPFATSGVRINPMVGVSKSIGLFAAHYLLTSMAGFVGSSLMPPMIAALLPNLLMVGFAIWLHRRLARPY